MSRIPPVTVMQRVFIWSFFLSAVLSVSSANADNALEATFGTLVDGAGKISLPQGFRLSWVHIGSWVVADASAPGHGFHDVYTQPEAARAFRETGKFIDGTVLVKEIRKLESAALTTGVAQWAGDNAVWFVMVRDSKQRYTGAHWQEGWGWALFDVENGPSKNISDGFNQTCRACHLPAMNDDWVFVDGYPSLRMK